MQRKECIIRNPGPKDSVSWHQYQDPPPHNSSPLSAFVASGSKRGPSTLFRVRRPQVSHSGILSKISPSLALHPNPNPRILFPVTLIFIPYNSSAQGLQALRLLNTNLINSFAPHQPPFPYLLHHLLHQFNKDITPLST